MTASVVAHGLGLLDPSTIEILQPEEGLLIHSAQRQCEYQNAREVDLYGECVWSHYSDFRLSWDVEADVMVLDGGLGDYHPGMLLGPDALAFANANGSLPFRFDMGDASRIIYESPSQEPAAGGLCSVKFRAVLEFGDRRLIGGSAWGGADSAAYIAWYDALVADSRVKGERGGLVGSPGGGFGGRVCSGFASIFPETAALDHPSVDGHTVYAWLENADGYVSGTSSAGDDVVAGNLADVSTPDGRYRWILVSPP